MIPVREGEQINTGITLFLCWRKLGLEIDSKGQPHSTRFKAIGSKGILVEKIRIVLAGRRIIIGNIINVKRNFIILIENTRTKIKGIVGVTI